MPRSKNKKNEVEIKDTQTLPQTLSQTLPKFTDVAPEVQYYIDLVNTVRGENDQAKISEAFLKIVDGLNAKIKKIAGKFRIPGHGFDDVYQEALIALQTKAIKDYDETRGADATRPAPFDRFALLCIRRHLSTTLKSAHQNKSRIQNEAKSLDQDRGRENSDELSLINIVCGTEGDVLEDIEKKENFSILMSRLLSRLSTFEKQVFRLYALQYTYEQISDFINKYSKSGEIVNIKGVDNALSRIKNKAKSIRERMENKTKSRNKKPGLPLKTRAIRIPLVKDGLPLLLKSDTNKVAKKRKRN